MNALSFLALFACTLVVGSTGNTYRMGGCPRVTVMKTIDFDKFLGDWYVVQRFNPMATCTKLTIEKGPEDQYAVNETSRPFGFHFNFHNQYLKARKLKFLRNDTNSIFRLDRNFAHFSLSTFGVVDTDYETYAVVWGCDPVLFGSVQNIDILTRDQKADKDVIKKAREAAKAMNVDMHPLENVDHTRCGSGTDNDDSPSEANKNTNNIVVDGP